MGELTGELAEGYKRLMDKKMKAAAGSPAVKLVSHDAPSENAPSQVTNASDKAPSKTTERLAEAPSVAKPPSSTTATRKGNNTETLATAPMKRRSFIKNRSKDRLAKFNQQRSISLNSQKDKENKLNTASSEDDMKDEDGGISHVSSNVSSPSMQHVSSTVSVETRRVANTSPVTPKSPSRAASPEFKPKALQPELEPKSADDSYDTDDTFPSLDWKEIERDAKAAVAANGKTSSAEDDAMPMDVGPHLVAEQFNPQRDNVSVASSRSGRSSTHSGRQLNAILEEQAELVFGAVSGKEPLATKGNDYDGLIESYEAIQFSPEDAHLFPSQQTKTSSSNASNHGSNENSPSRMARAYHRPHTFEKVVVIEKQQVTIDHPHPLGTVSENDTDKDDGDSKSDTSGLPSWASLPSVKKPKKNRMKNRPKRRPRKVTAGNTSRDGRNDGDPLGRAVSAAFDQLAGYAGFQEDVTSANGPHDEFTLDEEEYMSDESENIIADIHDALFSTFGCSVERARHRQLNDDDTLETDAGSKISMERNGRFIRHTRSGSHASDSMGSEPSLNIPTMPSYDERTDEDTMEDDATGSINDYKKPFGKSLIHDSSRSIESTPKYKIPEEFDAKPPSIPRTFSSKDRKLSSDRSSASVYSDSTGTYRKFVEQDHDAINLLEDADTFFFGKEAKKDILKVGKDLNKNVGEFVASIKKLLNPVAPKEVGEVGCKDVPSRTKATSNRVVSSRNADGVEDLSSNTPETAPKDPHSMIAAEKADISNDSIFGDESVGLEAIAGKTSSPDTKEESVGMEAVVSKTSSPDASEEFVGMEAIVAKTSSPDVSEPSQGITAGSDSVRNDSLFAATPKVPRTTADSSSEAGSDNTLEELKMMLIEEARQMAPIDFASESAMSTAVEEEKKEEDSHTDGSKLHEREDFVKEFEFDETVFAQAHLETAQGNASSPTLTTDSNISVPEFEADFDFGKAKTKGDSSFPSAFGNVEAKSMYNEFADTFATSQADAQQLKSKKEKIETTNGDAIVDSGSPATDESFSDPEQHLAGEGIEFDDLIDSQESEPYIGSVEITMEPNISSVHEVSGPIVMHRESSGHSGESQEISFESVEIPVECLPLLYKSDELISSVPKVTKAAALESKRDFSPAVCNQHKEKKKKGVMMGLFRSFKRNKYAKTPKSESTKPVLKKQNVPVNCLDDPASSKPANEEKTTKTNARSVPVLSKRSTTPKLTLTPSLNHLMESYLSEKFGKPARGSAHSRTSDPWRGRTAKSSSEVPKQRTEVVTLAVSESLIESKTPDRKKDQPNWGQYGFAISSAPNEHNSDSDFRGWGITEASNTQAVFRRSVGAEYANEISEGSSPAGFTTPDRTKHAGNRILNAPVKWESVHDALNEGIDLRAESKSTSSSGYSQPPAVDWGAVFEISAKTGGGNMLKADEKIVKTSPQKVSDFPDLESQASF